MERVNEKKVFNELIERFINEVETNLNESIIILDNSFNNIEINQNRLDISDARAKVEKAWFFFKLMTDIMGCSNRDIMEICGRNEYLFEKISKTNQEDGKNIYNKAIIKTICEVINQIFLLLDTGDFKDVKYLIYKLDNYFHILNNDELKSYSRQMIDVSNTSNIDKLIELLIETSNKYEIFVENLFTDVSINSI